MAVVAVLAVIRYCSDWVAAALVANGCKYWLSIGRYSNVNYNCCNKDYCTHTGPIRWFYFMGANKKEKYERAIIGVLEKLFIIFNI